MKNAGTRVSSIGAINQTKPFKTVWTPGTNRSAVIMLNTNIAETITVARAASNPEMRGAGMLKLAISPLIAGGSGEEDCRGQ